MKGATPAGPSVEIEHERDPHQRALQRRAAGARTAPSTSRVRVPEGTAFRSPRGWPATTPRVTALDGSPQASKRRRKHVGGGLERVGPEEDPRQADDVEGHQPPARCAAATSTRLGQPARRAPLAHQRSTARPTPWRPPQTTKVQAAPCQRPPSSMVSIRLRYVAGAAAAVAAERDVEVVAQPARQRDVPAPPEVLQRRGACRARRSSAGSGSRAAGRARWRCRCSRRSRSRSAPRRRRPPTSDLERRRAGWARRRPASTIAVARKSAITTFLNRPPTISEDGAAGVDVPRVARAARAAGRNSRARTIGPGDEVREERQVDGEVEQRRPARCRRGRRR